MSENRTEKIIEVIRKAAADFVQLESNGTSLITITEVRLSKDKKYANILFTVFPEDKEETVLDFLRRMRSGFREYIKEKTRLGIIPNFDFQIDLGEKHRQKLDKIPLN